MVTGDQVYFLGLVSGGDTEEVDPCREPGPSPMALGEGPAGRDNRPLAMSPRRQDSMLTPYS